MKLYRLGKINRKCKLCGADISYMRECVYCRRDPGIGVQSPLPKPLLPNGSEEKIQRELCNV